MSVKMCFFYSNEYPNIFGSRYVCQMNIRIYPFNLCLANKYPLLLDSSASQQGGKCSFTQRTTVLGCHKMQQVARNYYVSYMWLHIYFKSHKQKIVSFHEFLRSCHLFLYFHQFFEKLHQNTLVQVLTIFLTYPLKCSLFVFIQ